MAKIVKFPRPKKPAPEQRDASPTTVKTSPSDPLVLRVLWVLTVLLWPILKWVFALDCLYQLIRAIYHSNTPGVYGYWTFAAHFAVFCALTYFVSVYKPKGL